MSQVVLVNLHFQPHSTQIGTVTDRCSFRESTIFVFTPHFQDFLVIFHLLYTSPQKLILLTHFFTTLTGYIGFRFIPQRISLSIFLFIMGKLVKAPWNVRLQLIQLTSSIRELIPKYKYLLLTRIYPLKALRELLQFFTWLWNFLGLAL